MLQRYCGQRWRLAASMVSNIKEVVYFYSRFVLICNLPSAMNPWQQVFKLTNSILSCNSQGLSKIGKAHSRVTFSGLSRLIRLPIGHQVWPFCHGNTSMCSCVGCLPGKGDNFKVPFSTTRDGGWTPNRGTRNGFFLSEPFLLKGTATRTWNNCRRRWQTLRQYVSCLKEKCSI